jgi:streptomycin 6-kinase
MIEVPGVVRNKVRVAGGRAVGWLEELPGLVAELEAEWEITVGRVFTDATEALVAEATRADGTPAVLKLVVPRPGTGIDENAANEIAVLRLTGGDGCVRLLRDDADRGALLLERLGRSLFELGLPLTRRLEILCDTAARVWRPAAGCGLPTGADKGRWLADHVTRMWDEVGRPCAERTVELARRDAERRVAAHDDERAVLVHGDVHQWNALEAPGDHGDGDGDGDGTTGFKLVDPDGLLAEAEYDLGILLREDPVELLDGDPRQRARWLAARTGLDATAIWEWGNVERVATGLLSVGIDLQPIGREMLATADHLASWG